MIARTSPMISDLGWKLRFSVILITLLTMLSGCGERGPSVVPVEGTVSLDGSPLRYKSLLFVPTDGTPGNGAGGFTDGDGHYALIAVVFGATKDFKGCPPGRYRVVVSESSIPLSEADFESVQNEPNGDEPVAAIGPASSSKVVQEIPRVYTSEDTTTLVLEVPEDGGIVDVKLSSHPD